MIIKEKDEKDFIRFENDLEFRKEILTEINGISTCAISILGDNKSNLNINNFISQLSSENRKSSLSPHIDTLRDLTTSKVKLICLYNPGNVLDSSFTGLIKTGFCAKIADDFLFQNLDRNLEAILPIIEDQIIQQYYINTGIKLNKDDNIVRVYLMHILFANRKLNFEHNNRYFYLKDEYTEEVAQSSESKLINLDGSQKLFLLHNDIMDPKIVHFRYNPEKRKSVLTQKFLSNNEHVNTGTIYKGMILKNGEFSRKVELLKEIG